LQSGGEVYSIIAIRTTRRKRVKWNLVVVVGGEEETSDDHDEVESGADKSLVEEGQMVRKKLLPWRSAFGG
jgi:hypothetical protein